MPETLDACELVEKFASEPGVESTSVEFKSKEITNSTEGKKKLIRTLAAMANAGGGIAIVGVRLEDGDLRIQGFDPDSEIRQTLTHVSHQHTYPPVDRAWDIQFQECFGKHILLIELHRPQAEPIRYTGDGEEEYITRHEDNTEQMSRREVIEFVKASYTDTTLDSADRPVPVQRSTSVSHDAPTVESHLPTTALDRVVTAAPAGHTVVFGGGILNHRLQKSTVYSLSRVPKSLEGYGAVPKLLETATDCLGANTGHQFGYTFRVGDAQIIGNSIESLTEDLSRLRDINERLANLSTSDWLYGPSLSGFTSTDFGLLWFAVQDEGGMKRWDLELLCPDIPLNDTAICEFFETVAEEPQFYDHQTGTHFVEINGSGVQLSNTEPVSCLGNPNWDSTYVVADNPLYGWPEDVSASFDPPLQDLFITGIEALPRLPFHISGGYQEDLSDPSYYLNLVNYCHVSGTHPTLLVQSLCAQHDGEKQSILG